MGKAVWKPGTLVYPVPAVMISCGDAVENYNILTIAWTGTINTNPAMTYISVRPSRYSYEIIKRTGEFVINLTTQQLTKATDFCGVRSGRDINKFKYLNLTPVAASVIKAPLIDESPVNIECKVSQIIPLGSHDMFMAEVVAVNVDDKYIDETGKFWLERSNPICYSHGQYYGLTKSLGHFGFSVKKKK
jgi:flavin reductase (DIM6/NTAB) family NADH-FMN oxidoreductase RutF